MNTERLIDIITSINRDLALNHSVASLIDTIKESSLCTTLKISINFIEASDIIYGYSDSNDNFETVEHENFTIQHNFLKKSHLALISDFLENRMLIEIERYKVSVFRTCDAIFDESINSAYGREESVLDYLQKEFKLLSAEHIHSEPEDGTYTAHSSKIIVNEAHDVSTLVIKMEFDANSKIGYLQFTKKGEFSQNLIDLLVLSSEVFDTNVVQTQKASMYASRFKKYVGNSEVLDKLIKNPSLLDIKRRDVVIMSVDLVNSTKFASESSDPIDVFHNINSYLDFIAKIITSKENQGTLDKYIGDEVMGIFGAPLEDEGFVEKSINCAFEIIEKIEIFNRERNAIGLKSFNIKITMGYAKDVVVGEVGSEDTQVDYTAIGDDVNKVFRMASFGRENTILANENLAKMCTSFHFELLEKASFKGIDQEEHIYKIVKKS